MIEHIFYLLLGIIIMGYILNKQFNRLLVAFRENLIETKKILQEFRRILEEFKKIITFLRKK